MQGFNALQIKCEENKNAHHPLPIKKIPPKNRGAREEHPTPISRPLSKRLRGASTIFFFQQHI